MQYEDEIQERIRYYEEKEKRSIWASAKWFNPKENLDSQFATLILEHHTKKNQVEDEIIEEYKKLKSL